jgi:hypothetical protein
MPKIILKNSSHLSTAINEVKIGPTADSACDSRLQYLGSFRLLPTDSVVVANVTENTEVYWKNVNEPYWTHMVAWRFDDETVLEASMSESGSVPVDACRLNINSSSSSVAPTLTSQVLMDYVVPAGSGRTIVEYLNSVRIEFSTTHSSEVAFTLHVEGEDGDRYTIYHATAVIFPDGKTGAGPYQLMDRHVRKIHIANCTGPVRVIVTRV